MGCISSKKKLSKSDLEFLEENTEFTKDQIIEWYEGFIVSRSQNQICKKKKERSFPLTIYTSNNHMVHRHCEIAFPV
jgi:Ca2+-binding EF-hand superfamily protein